MLLTCAVNLLLLMKSGANLKTKIPHVSMHVQINAPSKSLSFSTFFPFNNNLQQPDTNHFKNMTKEANTAATSTAQPLKITDQVIGQIISLALSREEYVSVLQRLDINTAGAVGRALPSPDLVDSSSAEDVLSSTKFIVTEIEPDTKSEPECESDSSHHHQHDITNSSLSVSRIVRSNTRLFAKSYLLLLLFKNGKTLWQVLLLLYSSRKRSTSLRRVTITSFHAGRIGFSLNDGVSARIALVLAAIPFTYQVVYKLLLRLRPQFASWLEILKLQETKVPIPKELWIEAHTFTPLVAGLVSGSLFRFLPKTAFNGVSIDRDMLAIYALMRTSEMLFNFVDDLGYLHTVKPKLLGSWALFPFSFSHLFHSFFFNPETNTSFVNKVLTRLAGNVFPVDQQPRGYVGVSGPWPSTNQFVEGLAQASANAYPQFKAPLMFPNTNLGNVARNARFPNYLEPVKPAISRAHPAIGTIAGAMMHPFEPSMFRAFTETTFKMFPKIGKYVFALYLIQGLAINSRDKKEQPKNKRASSSTTTSTTAAATYIQIVLHAIAKSLRTTSFIVLTTVFAFSGIEVTQRLLNPNFLSTYRFKLIGFMAGLCAFIDQVGGRGRYIFAARAAILTYWKVFIKTDKRGITKTAVARNMDIYVFAGSFAVMMTLFDRSPESISGSFVRKVLSWVKNDEFKDGVVIAKLRSET